MQLNLSFANSQKPQTSPKLDDWGEKLENGRKGTKPLVSLPPTHPNFRQLQDVQAFYESDLNTWGNFVTSSMPRLEIIKILFTKDEYLFKFFEKPKLADIIKADLPISSKAVLFLMAGNIKRKPTQKSNSYHKYARSLVNYHYLLRQAKDGHDFHLGLAKANDIVYQCCSPKLALGVTKNLFWSSKVLSLIDPKFWKHITRLEVFYTSMYVTSMYANGEFVQVIRVGACINKKNYFENIKIDDNPTFEVVANLVQKMIETSNIEQTKADDEKLPPISVWVFKSTNEYFIRFDKDPLKRIIFQGDKESVLDMQNCQKGSEQYHFLMNEWQKILNERLTLDKLHPVNDEIKNTPAIRQGDITPEMMGTKFGLRGIEFGNWVKQGKGYHDRQDFINKVYDGFIDLCSILNVSADFIGLNGTLGFAMGARGRGKHLAHYERNSKVINLTKTKGNGSLAHEWLHALDNFLASHNGENKSVYIKEKLFFIPSFEAVAKRANLLDKSRGGKPYFSTMEELTARYFESMVFYKLKQQGLYNRFLVNYNQDKYCASLDTYPYVREDEHNLKDYEEFWELMAGELIAK